MIPHWWTNVTGADLAQGDLLPDCLLPIFHEEPDISGNGEPMEQTLKRARLIIVTQSCDLENQKVDFVALCPLHTLDEFEAANPDFAKKGRWNNARKGRVEGLHLVASPVNPENNREAFVVDFGHIVSIPFGYLSKHAAALDNRWRLEPPFLEHFSQAFARFFMRVGLPSAIPPYR